MGFPAKSYVLAFVLLATVAAPTRAADNWVDCEFGLDTNPGTSTSPYKTIQWGVDNAGDGDTVWVKAGTCFAGDQAFPVRMTKGVSVVGAGNQATFIRNADVGVDFAAFYFGGNDIEFKTTQRISDMHIRTDTDGIQIINGSPTIANNVIRKGSNGVAITTLFSYAVSTRNAASPIIEDNIFYDANTGVNAQVVAAPINAIIRRNWFLGNQTGFPSDVGIQMQRFGEDDLSPIIENNVTANARIGLVMRGGRPTIVNNTAVNNGTGVAFYQSGAYPVLAVAFNNNLMAYNDIGVDEVFGDAMPIEMKNNGFFGNVDVDYFDDLLGPVLDVNTLPAASGNITGLRPNFVDPTTDDWHLLLGSPMTNRGTSSLAPTRDIDQQSRSGPPDIGADEVSGFLGFPNLIVTSYRVVSDRCPGSVPPGNDGDIDPGEVIDVTLTVTNISPFAGATAVRATIVADGPDVLPTSALLDFGAIPALGTVTSTGTYSFRYTPSPLVCASKIRFFIDFETAETGPLPRGVFELAIGTVTGCQLCSSPMWPLPTDVVLPAPGLLDICGKGSPPGMNLAIEPGEDGELTFTVQNTSAVARASSVILYITTSTPGVTPTSGTVAVGSVAAASSVVATAPFRFALASSVSCGSTVDFDVAVDWLELAPSPRPVFPVSLPVPGACVDCRTVAPIFALAAPPVGVTDSCAVASPGAGDGRIDRGEHLDLVLSLRNTAVAAGATNVTGKLYSLSPLANPGVFDLVFGSVGPGATVPSSVAPISVSAAAACGAELQFELELTSDQTGVVAPRLPFSLFVATGCSLCAAQPPVMSAVAPTIVDRCPYGTTGGDAILNAGELLDVTLNLVNGSLDVTATGVTASLSFDEGWIGPPTALFTFADVPPLAAGASNTVTFSLLSHAVVCGDDVTLSVVISTNETGPLPAQDLVLDAECPICEESQPDLSLLTSLVTGRCPYGAPGGDGKIDAGEFVDIVLRVQNADLLGLATGLTATLSTADLGVFPAVTRTTGPDIPALTTGSLNPASFYLDPSTPCGTTFTFNVQVASVETGLLPVQTVTVTVDLGCAICQAAPSGVLLYRATVLDPSVGWKQLIPLPLDSTGAIDPGWPRSVVLPGSQEDLGVLATPWPVTLYRVLSDLDVDQGNVLRMVKSGTGVRISY